MSKADRRPTHEPEPERNGGNTAEALLLTIELGTSMADRVIEITGDKHLAANAPAAVLAMLWLQRPLRPRDVAERIGTTSGGIIKAIDRLEAAGLVSRSSLGSEDGRGILIDLTPEGEQAAEAILEAVGPILATFESRLQSELDLSQH
jgi:DNA-binding PadR family transcriptional regulator